MNILNMTNDDPMQTHGNEPMGAKSHVPKAAAELKLQK
jgi:hypothetical protein